MMTICPDCDGRGSFKGVLCAEGQTYDQCQQCDGKGVIKAPERLTDIQRLTAEVERYRTLYLDKSRECSAKAEIMQGQVSEIARLEGERERCARKNRRNS